MDIASSEFESAERKEIERTASHLWCPFWLYYQVALGIGKYRMKYQAADHPTLSRSSDF